MTSEEQNDLQKKYPFLSVVEYINQEYLGIIQNADAQFINIYTWDDNWSDAKKKKFITCGETWWWESNRNIPINLFLKTEFSEFRKNLKTFSGKESKIAVGPTVNLRDLLSKKIKRRTITLVKDV